MVRIKHKTIRGEQAGPSLLICAGVHGDEFEPMVAVRRLMTLVEPSELRGTLTLAPVVNEAAFVRKHRCADDGLDLARTCPGRPDGSITEQTAHAISQMIIAADMLIDLHTGGTTMTVLPFSGYSMASPLHVLEKSRRMGRSFNLPILWSTASTAKGRTLSIAREHNVPCIYAEYLGGARCDPHGINDYVNGCLGVMSEFDMIDYGQPPCRIKHIVEDEREDSAFMQIQNPAPIDGFFEPEAGLGDRVTPGQLIGTVCDVSGERVERIHSHQSGIVITLTTFPRVNRGDGLAVICEVDRPYGGWPA